MIEFHPMARLMTETLERFAIAPESGIVLRSLNQWVAPTLLDLEIGDEPRRFSMSWEPGGIILGGMQSVVPESGYRLPLVGRAHASLREEMAAFDLLPPLDQEKITLANLQPYDGPVHYPLG